VKTNSGSFRRKGFLARLRKDQSGNVIAILAVAIIPAIGIVGGAVDMSRVFIVRTSLQAACDAGSLMGRRVMGSGAWTDNGGKANDKADEMFVTNFEEGSYGTTNLVKTFSEDNGKVSGVATVDVPMALMSVFGIDEKPVAVTCDAEMRLPASDIMFVLDTTGSMNCPDNDAACTNNGGVEAPTAKIKGLRTAAACFYEALTKQNIAGTGYDPEDCGETTDPQGATSDVRLRFGFVPYSVNANVGRLLPLNYMADQWTYQSREPSFTTTTTNNYDYTLGNESGYTQGVQGTLVDAPSRNINNWTNLNQNLAHTNGSNYSYRFQSTKNGSCGSNIPNSTLSFNGTTYTFVSQNPATLTYPVSSVTKTYKRTDVTAQYLYQYSKQKVGNNYYCQLQYKTTSTKTRDVTFTTTAAVTWTGETVTSTTFNHWTYKPVTMNVGALKNTASNSWNGSLTTNLGDNGTNKTVDWKGCVEERATTRITDNDPSDNWNPIPTGALDMDIESAPTSDAATKWGPLLGGVVYNKYKLSNSGWGYTTDQYQTSENRTYYPNGTYVNYNGSSYTATDTYEYCPTAAKLYSEMDGAAFATYLNSLVTGGNTYHDIGLLWGARLMAPKGIFKSVTADRSDWTERHMIFMTDGNTSVFPSDYSAHGVHWWDRRQNSGTAGASQEWLEANVDARTQALCRWVRSKNITLWVIAFGENISEDTMTNLQNCATQGRFFEAQNTTDLITNFKSIANTISALRLTN
jgi:Putative Flp pilus-assembly TadE/G-like